VKLVFHEERIRDLVNKKVLAMLKRRAIDYLGVSIDALLVICPVEVAEAVKAVVSGVGVRMDEIGKVAAGEGAEIVVDGESRDFSPKFRESAYTPIKKVVGESGGDFETMKRKVDKAVEEAIRKKDKVKRILKSS
jgi:hydrogenase expression/formation protein